MTAIVEEGVAVGTWLVREIGEIGTFASVTAFDSREEAQEYAKHRNTDALADLVKLLDRLR